MVSLDSRPHVVCLSPGGTMYSLKLLGGASIEGPEGPLIGPAAQRHRLALLALLADASPAGITREKLVGYLWPNRESARARHALSDSVYRIHQAVGGETVEAVGEELRLDAAALPSDLGTFRSALDRQEWQRAVAAYDGPFLDGFHLPDTAAFERWVDRVRRTLQDAYRRALEELATTTADRGDRRTAVSWWRRLAADDPYNARVTVHLMEALEATGARGEALERARRHARLLADDLNAEPDPAVQAVADRIRTRPRTTTAVKASSESPGGPSDPADGSGAVHDRTPKAAPDRSGPGTDETLGTAAATPETAPVASDAASLGREGESDGSTRRNRWTALAVATAALLVLGSVVLHGADWLAATSEGSHEATAPVLPADAKTIAVLPLDPVGFEEGTASFAHGIHADLITALSKVGGFRVVSRGSVLPYRTGEKERGRIASELDADFLVEGTVRRTDGRVRLNVHLTDVASGEVIWGDDFEREVDVRSLFAIQASVTDRIVAALERSLTPDQRERIAVPPTERLSAYQLYHQSEEVYDGTRAGNVLEVQLLRRAVEIDPSFAEAWGELGVAYAWRPLWTGFPTSAWDSAVAFARRAIEADPEESSGHTALSDAYGQQGFLEPAISSARSALVLNPNDALAAHRLARPLHEGGDFDEALPVHEEAVRLSPNASTFRVFVGHTYVDLGLYERARRWYESTLTLHPDHWAALEGMGTVHLLEGRRDSALAHAERISAGFEDEPGPLAAAAMLRLFAGDRTGAARDVRRVDELVPDAPVHARATTLAWTMSGFLRLQAGDVGAADSLFARTLGFVNEMIADGVTAPRWPYEVAQIHAARGRTEEATTWLERAYDQGFRWAWMLERNPMFDPIRTDPRFRGLLARTEAAVDAMRERVVELR